MKLNFQKSNCIFAIFLFLIFIVYFIQLDEKLSSFVKSYFSYILLTFLLSFSFILYDLINSIKQKSEHKFKYSQENKDLINKLKKLSYEEKNILSLYMNDKTQEKSFNPNDQAIAWLESIKLITNTSKVDGNKKVFRIDPTVSKHLSQNPNALY